MLKFKHVILVFIYFCLIILSGCAENKFEVIEPPINDFPKANEYREIEVTKGNFILTKSFNGIIENRKLIIDITPQIIESFKSGEKGVISFMEKGKSFEINSIAVGITDNNTFIAEPIESSTYMPDKVPAKFSIITYQNDNAIIISKNAVAVLEENTAIVLKITEKGLLEERKITIGEANETHYEVIDGIEVGEKVVVRK